MQTVIELEQRYGSHNYHPLPVVLTRGEGVHVWDEAGKCYLDMMSAYSAVSHGHCHPILVETLHQQAQQLGIVSRAFYSDKLAPFLQKLVALSGLDSVLPMNTGAEACETALKAARKWAYTQKGVAPDQAEIIACQGNFHGRTISVVGLSSEEQYRDGFGPFPAGLKLAPYGDVDAIAEHITPNTAALLIEPIQGEGGIVVPPAGFLKACQELCKQHNVLLIMDEVQTGLGRTGKLFAYQHEGIQPDGLILGKALGGGLLPVSVFIARQDIMDVFQPGDHGSTFGGYPLAAAVGLRALEILEEDNLVERSAELGDYFMQQLRAMDFAFITEVRGRGLFIGVDTDPKQVSARDICLALLDQGLLSKETHGTVIRLAPPLIITREQIDEALQIMQDTFSRFV